MSKSNIVKKAAAGIAALAVISAACGSADTDTAGGSGGTQPATTIPGSDPTTTAVLSSGGWIDGEPAWYSTGGDEGAAEPLGAVPSADAASSEVADFDTEAREVAPPGIEEPSPEPPFDDPPVDTPLRAGSVDDNADYQGFLDYLERIRGMRIPLRTFDPSGRIVVTVTGSNGLPANGIEVVATVGQSSVALRTTADGTIRFFPSYLDAETSAAVDFTIGEATITATAGSDVALTVDQAGGADAPVPLDILFLLDATGSMGDEIDRLKATIDIVADRVALLDPAPDVRFAMTLYRDQGDAFVTANYDFTGDVTEFQAALADVIADGGGDYPEALDEGLADALAKPSWRNPGDAVQLIFVVADAPPQVNRQVPVAYTDSIRDAAGRGIKIFPVASSESDDQAEAVFRQLAQATGAPFVFLSNGADGAALGGSSDIQSTDYEELALDELVVRLIAEELNDLNGGEITVPTTLPPVTTNPEGQ